MSVFLGTLAPGRRQGPVFAAQINGSAVSFTKTGSGEGVARRFWWTLFLLGLALFVPAASAQVLVERFNYPDGEITQVSGGLWTVQTAGTALNVGNGTAIIDQPDLTQGHERVSRGFNTPFTTATNSVAYYAFNATWTALPVDVIGSYFASFSVGTDAGTYYGRVGASLDGAAAGHFRISVANANWSQVNSAEFPLDLSLNVTYTVVVKYDLVTRNTTLWVNPVSEASASVTATDAPVGDQQSISAISLREGTSSNTGAPGSFRLDDLFVGASFGQVISSGPPQISQQPVSASVTEGQMAAFSVSLANPALVTTQWRRNGLPIAGGTNTTLAFGPVTLADNKAVFNASLANSFGVTNTADAALTVLPDTTPPALTGAVNLDSITVELDFSEPIAAAGAAQISNYSIAGAAVVSASLGADPSTILLKTSPLARGSNYTVTVSGLTDRAQAANPLPPGSQASFLASELVPAAIGNAGAGDGVQPLADGGYSVTSSGAGAGGTADEFQFAWQQKTGDFDLKVRVEGVSLVDVWSQAGLMARESLGVTARFAAALATPSLSGIFFESRSGAGAASSMSGSYPVNYPYTWLRLQRVGNVFSGFASFDGVQWVLLGANTLPLPATVYVGPAVASHQSGQPVTASFHELQSAAGVPLGSTPQVPFEPLAACTRKTSLVISEIMFHAPARPDGKQLEFIELFNSNPWTEDISGYQLAGDIIYTFPAGTSIPGGGFLVVAKSPADFQSVYGLPNVTGPYAAPATAVGLVQLLNNGSRPAVYLEVPYMSFQPWTGAADGTGHSLVLKRPSYGEGFVEAWGASEVAGGSPGAMDGYRASPVQNVVINELSATATGNRTAFVEFYNHGTQPADLSGCRLIDFPGTNVFVIPAGTLLPAAGFVSFGTAQLGFTPDPAGGALYLETPDALQIVDVVRYGAQENGVSSGRVPDGSPGFVRLQAPSPGASNGPMRATDVVINEIMVKPMGGLKDDQFVELYNQSALAVDLTGWKFTHGIAYTFPSGAILAPKGYLVVARNASRLLTNYPGLSSQNTFGNFSGSLSGGGERITLARPLPQVTAGKKGQPVTNLVDVPMEEFTYGVGGRWGHWSDGGGSSIELRDPRSDRRLAANWGDSDETAKAAWTTIEATSRLDLGATQGSTPIDRVEISMSGEGECLVDNVEVIEVTSATNRLSAVNSSFESGLGDWVATGDHIQTVLEPSGGYGGGQCMHVHATDRGDTMVNHLRVPLTKALAAGQTVTLRLKVRWLHGFPELVFRVKGNYAEATGAFNLPANPGTPGQPNSLLTANAGPAIVNVSHWPPLPVDRQPVVVSARVADPDGLSQAILRYRMDPATTYTDVPLKDDGTGGDAVAGDGIFSGTIPGLPAGTLVAFYISAADNTPAKVAAQFPADAPSRECLVRFGDPMPNSAFGGYHLLVSDANATQWANQQSISNERHDCTFIYGNWRVIYNVGGKFAGSPYHQGFGSPLSNNCHYSLEMPGDDQFLGATSFNKIHAPGNGPWEDDTLQREQTAYWMARQIGIPWNNRRYVNFFINGNRRQPSALMEDTQTPDADVVSEHFPNDKDGNLFKLQPWFEFADDGTTFDNKGWCTLNNYVSGGQKKLQRYRPNFLVRAAKQTANDYTDVFELIDTAHLPVSSAAQKASYISAMNSLVDTEEWLRTSAVEHAVGNWDSFLNSNGQNMYGYKPTTGPWTLFIWDYNIVLGVGSDGPTGDDLFKTTGGDSGGMAQFSATPVYRRSLWRTYWELANMVMAPTNVNPLIDSKYAMFRVEGLAGNSPTALKSWIKSRQTYLLGLLKNIDVPFSITAPVGTNFSTGDNPAILTGTAPMTVQDIEVNGTIYPVTWVDVRHWQANLPLVSATNDFVIRGLDRFGNAVATNMGRVEIAYTGVLEPLAHQVVINEVMYHAPVPGAEFIELFNSATNTPFDLSNWRIDGIGYIFPGGIVIPPGGYLVLAKDRQAFASAYGDSIPVAGVFSGFSDVSGMVLKLVKPGASTLDDRLVNAVRFHNTAPWPAAADGSGPSLQLIDASQDNFRPANWAASATNDAELATPGRANTFAAALPQFPNLFINEVLPENTSLADNFGVRDPIIEIFNSGQAAVDLGGFALADSYASLAAWNFPAGTSIGAGQYLVIWADAQPEQSMPGVPHASFRLAPGSGSVVLTRSQGSPAQPAVLDYLDYALLSPGRSYGSFPDGQAIQRRRFYFATPGASNNPAIGPNPVFINEWMAANTRTITNSATGLADDWLELYNAGDQAADLAGFALASPASNASRFIIPAGTVVPPHGWLLVWADKDTAANTPGGALHTSFHLSKKGTDIGFFAPDGAEIDRVSFGAQAQDISEGRAPDGGDAPFVSFSAPTPGAANIARALAARIDGSSGEVHLSFSTQPGLRYQVVFRDTLNGPWQKLADFSADSASAEVVDSALAGTQRYYQFVVEVGN